MVGKAFCDLLKGKAILAVRLNVRSRPQSTNAVTPHSMSSLLDAPRLCLSCCLEFGAHGGDDQQLTA